MNKKLQKELKEQLEKNKEEFKKNLQSFAKEDKNLPGDWNARFPNREDEIGGAALEIAADKVEEYNTLLPIEHSLETRLQDINLALEKIKKGKYGKCENCDGEINEKRLKIYPEARLCMKCQKNK